MRRLMRMSRYRHDNQLPSCERSSGQMELWRTQLACEDSEFIERNSQSHASRVRHRSLINQPGGFAA